MKEIILAMTAVIFIVSIIISACLTSHAQSTNVVHETHENSDESQQATSVETTGSGEKPQDGGETSTLHNQDCNLNDTENTQSVTSNNPPQSPVDTNQNENTGTNTCPPDGRVYWTTQEASYAYTTTYAPKKWTKIPIMLLKLES